MALGPVCLEGPLENQNCSRQRKLKRSQFHRSFDPHCYKYVENGSNNITGVNPTENPVYAQPDAQPRCLIYLLDKYFSC